MHATPADAASTATLTACCASLGFSTTAAGVAAGGGAPGGGGALGSPVFLATITHTHNIIKAENTIVRAPWK